jgi:hypothetical protein
VPTVVAVAAAAEFVASLQLALCSTHPGAIVQTFRPYSMPGTEANQLHCCCLMPAAQSYLQCRFTI